MLNDLKAKLGRGARIALSLALVSAFGYGFYGLVTYAVPLSHDDFRQAQTSYVADQTEILINGAAKAYEEGRYEESTKVLELALEQLVSKSGRYQADNRWKLERVYFLLGKSYHRMKQFDKAVQNYEDTLRMNPDHMPAKYNLEMIQSEAGGGGGDGGGGKKNQPKI